jgi:chemotaxis protein methyltransferase CheR
VNASDYEYLRKILKQRSGLVLSADKPHLLENRLLPLMRRLGIASLSALIARMRGGEEAVTAAVVEAMAVKETFFYRDKAPFDIFSDGIVPALMAARAAEQHIRCWCAAASTGQEAYSLAICLKEMGVQLAGWRIDILATDLSLPALDKASAGIYSQSEVQRGLPIQQLIKYFLPKGETWQVAPEIRAVVRFQPFNLLDDFAPLGGFDVVFCRNVLIYFDQPTRTDILCRIAKLLPRDGYLILGAAETAGGLTEAFRPLADRPGIYAVNPDALPAAPVARRLMLVAGGR